MQTSNPKDYFAQKAGEYDHLPSRVQNVVQIAQTILKELSISPTMHVLDFGSGTGLLLSQIAPFVKKITAVDVSPAMTEVLRSKLAEFDCEVQIREMDLTKESLDEQFDVIMSSMTIHHIEQPQLLFNQFYGMLKDNGHIAIADIDKEDGSFHTEDTGVHHLGFDRDTFMAYAKNAGFTDLKIQTASVVHKPQGDYPVFLLTGKK
ncbi:class I SAM-dependent methyltransferase [bacterium]|nr:MAG: class I SAM-dependent methyltransferase [bacterium]